MLAQRIKWSGGAIISALGIYLAWAQVANDLAKWSIYVILGIAFVASLLIFPWTTNDDGSPRRIINVRPRGHHNPTQIAGKNSTQIVNEGGGTFNIGRPTEGDK